MRRFISLNVCDAHLFISSHKQEGNIVSNLEFYRIQYGLEPAITSMLTFTDCINKDTKQKTQKEKKPHKVHQEPT